MARTDLSYEELIAYRPSVAEPTDFDAFWSETITETRSFDLNMELQQVNTPYRTVDIHDVSFCGFAGDRIKAWLLAPRQPWSNSLATTADATSLAPSCPGPAPATPT